MKTATHRAHHADRPLNGTFQSAHDHAADDRFSIPHAAFIRMRKVIKGGSDGGPPAGMVMPDMTIGAVPYYG